ncbi:MAG: TetR/AcrR family transcriptional regulator [Deltaproteobacteria bacterium]|nr:TetR/AcrR family transcriptional regulator [Deltaproteobacteria bacterium]
MAAPRTSKKKRTQKPVEVSTQIKNKDLVERRRKQLIDESTKVFVEKGYHRTSIRDIAKATSFSMGNLYDYIRTKEDILYLVHQNMINNVYHGLFDLQEDEFEIKSGELNTIIRNAVEKTFEFQDEIILLYRESGSLSKEMMRSILALETRYIDMFKRLLDEANEEGLYKIQDTRFLANLIVYLISFLSLRRWSLREYSKERSIDLLMYYITRMLRSEEKISESQKKDRAKLNENKTPCAE